MSSVPPPRPELPEPFVGIAPTEPPPTDVATGGGVQPGWAPWTAPVALIAAFLFAIVGAVLIGAIGAAFGGSMAHPSPAMNIVATVLQDAAFVAAALGFASMGGRLLPSQFGLRRTPLWAAVGWAALVLLGFFLFSWAWTVVLDPGTSDKLPKSFGVHRSTVALVAVCVMVTVIAPIAEELFFRGFFFAALRNWRGVWPAAVLTGIVFGAIHAGSAPVVFLVPLGVLGFLLCLLRWRTGSLLPCMAVHALNNSIAFGIGELKWGAGPTLLLICGATGAVLLATVPFVRGERRVARALI